MKILIIGPFPLPTHGCSLANQVLIKQLRTRDNTEVEFIDTNSTNVSSELVGKFSLKKVITFLKSYKNIRFVKLADVVYITPGQTFFGILKYVPFFWYCRMYSIPYLIHIHGNHLGNEYKSLRGFKKKIFAYYIKRASAGIVLSKSLRGNFTDLLPNNRVYEVPNFAIDEVINSNPIKQADKLRILYLGNLMKEKGILDVLDSLILLKDNGIPFEGSIAGKIEDESQELILGQLNKLKGSITYHSVVHGQEKIDLLNNANIFILPTFYKMEGQPISLIEAMAAGNIILTTEFSGIPDIINEQNGYFVEPNNPQSIFNTLAEISGNLKNNVNEIGIKNMAYVKANFTERRFSENVLNALKAIINSQNVES